MQSMCIILFAGALCFLCFYTNITVQSSFGTYQYQIDLLEGDQPYEESGFFNTMLRLQVYDIMRYTVIRNQMEVDGDFYGSKIIDIQTYALRHELQQEEYISAPYSVENLIKWGQYGFEYNGDNLIERYRSAEGKYLYEYVTSDLNYEDLVYYLEATAQDIAFNYAQYTDFTKRYAETDTNALYYIAIGENESTTVYTNTGATTIEEARELICNWQTRYVDYDMESLQFDTNTSITEEELIQEMNRYDYTYTYHGNSQILIGVDTNYFYHDDFVDGYKDYSRVVPYIPYALVTCSLSLVIWIVAMSGSLILAGHSRKQEGIQLLKIDGIPTEIFMSFVLLFGVGVFYLYRHAKETIVFSELDKGMISIVSVACAMILYLVVVTSLLSFARRCKAGVLFRKSLLYYLVCQLYTIIRRVMRGISSGYRYLLKNKKVTIRTFVPYFAFLFLNVGLFFIGDVALAVAAVVDCVVALALLKESRERDEIVQTIVRIADGDMDIQLDSEHMNRQNQTLADSVNLLRDGIKEAVDISRKDERLKADLITNVSHDIKTPLTSIINYVDLLKREEIEDEKVQSYLIILEQKSNRLKHLIEDLVEASKISSGNIELVMEPLNIVELVRQSVGELGDLFEKEGLQLVATLPHEPIVIEADGRRMWRIIENLMSNALKYSLEQTRVYLDVSQQGEKANITIRNISKEPLKMDTAELTERFTRGDSSRSSEGSGLGLSIAKNLTQLHGGTFEIVSDGDLFKVTLEFT